MHQLRTSYLRTSHVSRPTRVLFSHTACIREGARERSASQAPQALWPPNVVKTFGQIQLVRKELPFAGYSVVKEWPRPLGVGMTGSRSLASPVNLVSCSSPPGRPARLPLPSAASARQPPRGLPTVAHALVGTRERRLVENTGLEPVTSWLQTRRSPS